MIKSSENVPNKLLESRDYQVILKLLDLVTTSKKAYIDNLIRLLDPMYCPSKYLKLLASYVGYTYDNKLSYESNRYIIKYYPYMIRNRGTVKGLMLATSIAIVADDTTKSITSALELLDIVYVEENKLATIYIYYPNYLHKINDLIEVVRPVGVGCKIIESTNIASKEQIIVSDTIESTVEQYSSIKRSIISEIGTLGHGEIGGDNE